MSTTKTETHNDAAIATVKGKAPRIAALKAWGTAETGATRALLACFHACAEHGATDPAEVAEARGWYGKNADGATVPNPSAAAYAATFNRAAKSAAIVGIKATRDAIDKAAKLPGRVHVNVGDALSAIGREAKSQGVKEATAAQGRAIIKAALAKTETDAKTAKLGKTPGKPRGARGQNEATAQLAAATVTSGSDWRNNVAAVRLAANMATRLAMPEGREAAARAYLKALQDAAELGAKLEA